MVPHATAPDTLWHYTDANGLFGILESRQFRFGDVGFLNDRTERTYSKEVLDQVFHEESLGARPRGLVDTLRRHVLSARSSDRLFICSFSETKESISQWQRYGADGTGYCLGFNTAALDEYFRPDMIQRVAMTYASGDQKDCLREPIQRAADMYQPQDAKRAPLDINTRLSERDIPDIVRDVADTALRIKNPYFEDEKEWRYFKRLHDNDLDSWDQEFAVRGVYVKPFLRFPQREHLANFPRLPIVQVVCGPRLDVDIAIPAVERFLRKHGYVDVRAKQSTLATIWR